MALYYMSFFELPQMRDDHLSVSPAGQTKATYIIEVLDKIGHEYTAISLAIHESGKYYYPTKKIPMKSKGIFIVWSSFGQSCRPVRKISHMLRKYQLITFLSTLDEKDIVITYHSLITDGIITRMVRKRKFKLIVELEEIYQDVVECSKAQAYWEKEIIDRADGFILSTYGLTSLTGTKRPFVVANGTYKIQEDRGASFNDHKVHVVYAGNLDPRKGGGAAAAAAAQYLPEDYHIHILGFGSEQQIDDMRNLIQNISGHGMAAVTYDGLLSGDKYIDFLQSCDIGLSTQNPNAAFNATSFPSKVLSYMANGLRVVSARIEVIECSAVGDMITYYEEQTPEKIAEAILSVDLSQPYESRKRISELDEQFQKELKHLIAAI